MVKNKNTKKNDNNDNNETKTSFSSIDADNKNDFQTANMMNKISKIKKNKLKKNYTKIEEFNTLNNVSTIENHNNDTINENEQNESNLFYSYFNKIKNILGIQNNYLENFKDNEYEGHDNVKEPKSKTNNIRMKIIQAINNTYTKVNNINTTIASTVVTGISGNKEIIKWEDATTQILKIVGKNTTEFGNEIMTFAHDIQSETNTILNDISNSVNDIPDDTINSVINLVEKTSTMQDTLKNIDLPSEIMNNINTITHECDKVVNAITTKSETIYKDVENIDIENIDDALKNTVLGINSNIENSKDALKNIESMTDNKNDKKSIKKQKIQRIYSPKKTITDDIALVRNSIVLLETAALSLWVVYNWYFLMFYAPDNDIHIPNFSRLELLKQSNKSNSYSAVPGLKKMLLYLFEFAIWFPEKLDGFLINNENFFSFPGLTKHFLNGDSKFILIYIISFYCIKNFAISFKNFFIDLLTNAGGNKLINLMFAIVLILFFVSAFTFTFVGDMEADTKIIFSFASSMLNPIGTFITWLIRFFITITISVPMGAIICGLYLIIYSLFGRFIYGGSMEDIDDHIKSNIANFQDKDMCNTGSLWNMFYSILRILFKITEFIKNNILTIAYFFIFLYTTFTMTTNLSNQMNNKEILIFLIVCITISLSIHLFTHLRKYITDINDNSHDDKLDEHGFKNDFNPNKEYIPSKNTENNTSNKLE